MPSAPATTDPPAPTNPPTENKDREPGRRTNRHRIPDRRTPLGPAGIPCGVPRGRPAVPRHRGRLGCPGHGRPDRSRRGRDRRRKPGWFTAAGQRTRGRTDSHRRRPDRAVRLAGHLRHHSGSGRAPGAAGPGTGGPRCAGIAPVVVHAMLAGIGITIVLQQLHVMLGAESASEAWDNIMAMPGSIFAADLAAAVLGAVVIALLLGWKHLPAAVRRVPGPLVAVIAATALSLPFNRGPDHLRRFPAGRACPCLRCPAGTGPPWSLAW